MNSFPNLIEVALPIMEAMIKSGKFEDGAEIVKFSVRAAIKLRRECYIADVYPTQDDYIDSNKP